MANTNYNNPQGLLPQTGWKPSGFLAGGMVADQEQDYAKQMQMSNILKNLEIMKQQAEHQDYQANGPVREAERGFKVQDFRDRTQVSPIKAQSDMATYGVNRDFARPQAEEEQIGRVSKRKGEEDGLLADTLASILQSGLPPAEMIRNWREQGIPELEARTGQKAPEHWKNLDPEQMKMIVRKLTFNAQNRFKEQDRVMTESGLNTRQAMGDARQIEEARIRAAAGDRERTTAASALQARKAEYETAAYEKIVRQEGPPQNSEQEAAYRNRAKIEALQYAQGNPFGRAGATADVEGTKAENDRYDMALMTAKTMTPQKLKELRDGGKIKEGMTFKMYNKLFIVKNGQPVEIPAPSSANSPIR